jgi:hypothetical protein
MTDKAGTGYGSKATIPGWVQAHCSQPVLPVGCPWFICLSGTPKICLSIALQSLISNDHFRHLGHGSYILHVGHLVQTPNSTQMTILTTAMLAMWIPWPLADHIFCMLAALFKPNRTGGPLATAISSLIFSYKTEP